MSAMAKNEWEPKAGGPARESFAERERSRNASAEQHARQARQDLHADSAKTRGKTQKAMMQRR